MAISTRSLTVPTKEAADKSPCPCGCAPCEGTCCHLDCIVRPHFFCGQLLTDADLSALLKWASDRFGLSRYRHGWGVVCGLDVRCDPKRPAGIVVTPGYAVNCCGDDIVVCESATLDLSPACREEEDPCADLRRRYEAVAPGKVPGIKRDIQGEHPMDGITGSPDSAEGAARRVVDIYLRYDEKPSEPTTALGRGSCKQISECEYSRTRESYKLIYKPGVQGSDPLQARALRWHEGYEKCLEVLKEFRAQFTHGFPTADVRRWLVRWIDAHPQSSPCGTREAICGALESFLSEEKNLVRLLFELVLECRTAYLNCDCFGCDDDAGVPLARVWLTTGKDGEREGCRILAIDPYPPYRRPIQPECWPAPLGSVNVGRFIWHRWEEACTSLHDLGVHVNPKEFTLPGTLSELEKALQCDLFIKCDEKRDALVYNAGFYGERVVGFCKTLAPTPVRYDLEVAKKSSVPEAVDGQSVNYNFVVKNSGDGDLQVLLADTQANFTQNVGLLRPGESGSFNHSVVVHPNTAGGFFRNMVVAQGFSGGVKVVEKSFTHDLKILQPSPPLCPTITVDCPGSIAVGNDITFTARIVGGDPTVTPTFNWTISAGTITHGQGTDSIGVSTLGLNELPSVTATVEVGGYDPSCVTVARCTTTLNIFAPDCPTITVVCPPTSEVGAPLRFTAVLTGGDPTVVTPTFNWRIAGGRVTSGQGTNVLSVNTTGLGPNSPVTATVEVGGYAPSCQTVAEGTTILRSINGTRKFDEFSDLKQEGDGGIRFDNENARLDAFTTQLQSDHDIQGHIIIYGARSGRIGEVHERSTRAKSYLVERRGVDAARIVTVDGGVRDRLEFELWLAPSGAAPPTPTPTLSAQLSDNLTEINQIGPARAAKLNEAGISTFAGLASATVERLKQLVPEVGEDVLRGWIASAKSRTT